MTRRFDPAMRTGTHSGDDAAVAGYSPTDDIISVGSRAADLLRTRIDVERSAQNQELLASMDKRADLQLRLQRTVEGLSVVAISYYAVNLVSYMSFPFAEPIGISKGPIQANGM